MSSQISIRTDQYGLRIARHGGLHATGSYKTGGRSSLCFKGEYKAAIGTTVLVASMRDDAQIFHERRTPEGHTSELTWFSNTWTHVKLTIMVFDVLKVLHCLSMVVGKAQKVISERW